MPARVRRWLHLQRESQRPAGLLYHVLATTAESLLSCSVAGGGQPGYTPYRLQSIDKKAIIKNMRIGTDFAFSWSVDRREGREAARQPLCGPREAVVVHPEAHAVEPGEILSRLLQVVGTASEPPTGYRLTETTYRQPRRTSGGGVPSTGCAQDADVGIRAWVPYTDSGACQFVSHGGQPLPGTNIALLILHDYEGRLGE